jgi:UDP-3-O-[3-hydroxymyristoyl] glucosamine N-acyltransferase
LGDGAKVNAQSGVSKSINLVSRYGSPYDYTAALRSQAVTRKLPELEKRVKELEALVKQLLSEKSIL